MNSLEVLRRLGERGYRGGKTAVYELVKRLRPQAVRPICRFAGVAGEFSQRDFEDVGVATFSRYSDLGRTTTLQPPQTGSS